MSSQRLFLILSVIIGLSLEGPCSITTKVEEYTDCRDKRPTNPRTEVCCYLETSSNFKRCVEVRKTDIEEEDAFENLEKNIKAGTYDLWLNETYVGFDEYRTKNITIGDIESLRCNHSQFLYLGFFILLATLFSYF